MSLQSLIATGTKLWLDSIDPELVRKNYALGATGATSNPIIIADLIKTGRFDSDLKALLGQGLDDSDIAWMLTDTLVSDAESVFLPVWEKTKGNDGYVSFELDPLIEDPGATLSHDEQVQKYIELGKKWFGEAGVHKNRMIKVPATPAGLDALEPLAALGITLNVTIIFSKRQYEIARDAIWRGAQQSPLGLKSFKSAYSIFVSRVDVYTEKNVSSLSPHAQGMVGIVNAKRIWADNQIFWKNKNLPLQQEIIFASTGTKKASDPADKYVESLAGADIETNPPATNDAVQALNKNYSSQIRVMPSKEILEEIDAKVEQQLMEDTLMQEGIEKFANPQKTLLALIAAKRREFDN